MERDWRGQGSGRARKRVLATPVVSITRLHPICARGMPRRYHLPGRIWGPGDDSNRSPRLEAAPANRWWGSDEPSSTVSSLPRIRATPLRGGGSLSHLTQALARAADRPDWCVPAWWGRRCRRPRCNPGQGNGYNRLRERGRRGQALAPGATCSHPRGELVYRGRTDRPTRGLGSRHRGEASQSLSIGGNLTLWAAVGGERAGPRDPAGEPPRSLAIPARIARAPEDRVGDRGFSRGAIRHPNGGDAPIRSACPGANDLRQPPGLRSRLEDRRAGWWHKSREI